MNSNDVVWQPKNASTSFTQWLSVSSWLRETVEITYNVFKRGGPNCSANSAKARLQNPWRLAEVRRGMAAHLNGHGSELALHVCSNLLKPAEAGQRRSQLIEIILTASESLASTPNSKPRSPFRCPRVPQ